MKKGRILYSPSKKRGVSLIVLIITIIAVIILAGAVILTISNNNPIDAANEAVFKSDVEAFESELEIYKTNQYVKLLGSYDENSLQATVSYVEENGQIDNERTIEDLISSLKNKPKYKGLFEIVNGKLVFVGSDEKQKNWSVDVGVEVRYAEPQINISLLSNSTVNNNTDVEYKIEISSNYALESVVLENKIELLKENGENLGSEKISIGDLSGDDSSLIRETIVTVNTEGLEDGGYKIVVLENSVTNSVGTSNSQRKESTLFIINNVSPIAPDIAPSTAEWTNQDITITITYSEESLEKEYSLDGGNTWLDYIDPFAITDNATIIAKGTNNLGTESIYSNLVIDKIDKIAPSVPTVNLNGYASGTWTNSNVKIDLNSIDSQSGIQKYQYTYDGITWNNILNSYTISSDFNLSIIYRAIDNAGNVSLSTSGNAIMVDKTAPNIASTIGGNMLYNDPTFKTGINSTYLYNNASNGVVSNTRISLSNLPTDSGYGIEIKTTNSTSTPGWGGFAFKTPSAANKVYITKIIAKIPVGYNINWASNAIGNGGSNIWLTSQSGTGNWKEYVCKVTCGPSGTFGTTNYYYLSDGNTPTPSSPLIWYVAYATVFDIATWGLSNGVCINATDTVGIVGYGINQSSTVAPTYINCSKSTNFSTVIDNVVYDGTYYIWLKDQAGNVTKSPINVNSGYVGRFSFDNSILNVAKNKIYTGTGTSYAQGKVGNGLKIIGGQIIIPVSDLDIDSNTNVVSVAFWFKWNGEIDVMPIGFTRYDSFINTSNHFGFNSAQGDTYGMTNPFSVGTYIHVALIFNKGDYTLNKIYINGVKQTLSQKVGTQSSSTTIFTPNIYISGWGGAGSETSYRYNGSVIDELRIFNRALTDAEVVQLMNN